MVMVFLDLRRSSITEIFALKSKIKSLNQLLQLLIQFKNI